MKEFIVESLGMAVQVLGIVMMVVGYIWALVYCFRQGTTLGCSCLLLGFLVLIYLFVRGERGAIVPATTTYGGMLVVLIGSAIMKG